MSKKLIRFLKVVSVLFVISLITTLASYAIITDRRVPLEASSEPYVTLTGQTIINLPCVGGPGSYRGHTDWVSNDPYLPEARGLPFNYHFWNPCHGDQILRTPFLLDLTFWFLFYASIYAVYLGHMSHMGHRKPSRRKKH